MSEDKLTERELLIARRAAAIAIEEVSDAFYKQVGKSIVNKVLVWIGMLAIGFGMAKGWIKWGP